MSPTNDGVVLIYENLARIEEAHRIVFGGRGERSAGERRGATRMSAGVVAVMAGSGALFAVVALAGTFGLQLSSQQR